MMNTSATVTNVKRAHGGAEPKSKKVTTGTGRGRTKHITTLLWLVPLISIILLIWMIALNMSLIDPATGFGLNNEQWFMLTVFIIIGLIIVLIVSVLSSLMTSTAGSVSTSRAPDSSSGVVIEAIPDEGDRSTLKSASGAALVKIDSGSVIIEEAKPTLAADTDKVKEPAFEEPKPKPQAPEPISSKGLGAKIIEYPVKVGMGLYGDTYIKIDQERILKLRTLLIENYYLL